jgi:hypothetical protein
MGKLLELDSGSTKLLVETCDVGYDEGMVQAGGIDIGKNLDRMLMSIKPFCESIISTFDGLINKPESAVAEFGLSIAGEGNLFVVKASGEASIKITLTWSLK